MVVHGGILTKHGSSWGKKVITPNDYWIVS